MGFATIVWEGWISFNAFVALICEKTERNTKRFRFSEIGSSLGTRDLAARLRDDVMLDIDEIDKIIFDFEGVNVITNSFANVYFGKMIERISVEKFRNKFAFINANDFIQRVLISSF